MNKTVNLCVLLTLFLSACNLSFLTPPIESSTSQPIINPTITQLAADFDPIQSTLTHEIEPVEKLAIAGITDHTVYNQLFITSELTNPLTGLTVPDPNKLNRRPVLTKISNYPAIGRPHAGLSLADIVFEYYIGEYMNRFLALYYSQDTPKAWPLRSGRLIDAQLTNLFGGILVYGNADPRVETIITRDLYGRAIPFKMAACPPICGIETHSATGVWVDTAAVTDWAVSQDLDNERPDLSGLVFDTAVPDGGIAVNTLDVEYIIWNHGQWIYDPESEQYLRYIESWDGSHEYSLIPLMDQVTGQQVKFSNVVILYAEYVQFSPTYHDALIWENTTGKRALYFRDGRMYEGSWLTFDPYKPFHLLDSNNQPMRLKPGTTWFIIAGLNSSFSAVTIDHYYLNFAIP